MIDPANDSLRAAVAEVVGRDVHSLPDPLVLVSTEELIAQRDLLDAAIAAHVQVVDARDVTVAECAKTTRVWLVDDLHRTPAEAAKLCGVGRMLPTRPLIGEALKAGNMTVEHARAIGTCLRKLPRELADLADVVEKELIDLAAVVDPSRLAGFCREICDRLGGNETAEAAAQRRYGDRWLRLTPTYEGMHRLDGMLDPESAAVLHAALDPLTRPLGQEDDRTSAQRLADGLVTIAELALNTGDLPDLGGERPQVIATLPASDLFAAVKDVIGKTGLLNGQPATVTAIRRWACDAGIIPAVLSGDGEVLDLGRRTPTWSAAQRRALRIEDKGCGWPDCHEPLSRCRIHHLDWWSHGGHTTTKRGIHLCPFHHHVVHHTNWNINRDHNRNITVWRT